MKITISTYNLFVLHGSELLWVSDSNRFKRPPLTNKQTDKDFIVLENLDENLELLYNPRYNQELKEECRKKINLLKQKVDQEVFKLMKSKYALISK